MKGHIPVSDFGIILVVLGTVSVTILSLPCNCGNTNFKVHSKEQCIRKSSFIYKIDIVKCCNQQIGQKKFRTKVAILLDIGEFLSAIVWWPTVICSPERVFKAGTGKSVFLENASPRMTTNQRLQKHDTRQAPIDQACVCAQKCLPDFVLLCTLHEVSNVYNEQRSITDRIWGILLCKLQTNTRKLRGKKVVCVTFNS